MSMVIHITNFDPFMECWSWILMFISIHNGNPIVSKISYASWLSLPVMLVPIPMLKHIPHVGPHS